jgi:hypothetical protein
MKIKHLINCPALLILLSLQLSKQLLLNFFFFLSPLNNIILLPNLSKLIPPSLILLVNPLLIQVNKENLYIKSKVYIPHRHVNTQFDVAKAS